MDAEHCLQCNPDEYRGQTTAIRDHHRLDRLISTLRECMKSPPKDTTDFLRVTYLFYDDFKMTDSTIVETIPCS